MRKTKPTRLPAIRFIVDTYTSERDRNGNCYHWSRITSTLTGKSIAVSDLGGESNTSSYVRRVIDEPGEDSYRAISSRQIVVPKKQWSPPKGAIFSGQLTTQAILDLEIQTC